MSQRPGIAVTPPYVVTFYWGDDTAPYFFRLHEEASDTEVSTNHEILAKALTEAGAREGDEVRFYAVVTGRRPFGDRRVVLVAPHTYRREEP